jgi:hypothetical protein
MAVAAISILIGGCGRGDGVARYRVSGRVTFQGEPVPAGMIYFNPDAEAGNKGPSGFAPIVDGAYDTRSARGRGAIAGPQKISIDGHVPAPPGDASEFGGRLLFQRYQSAKELPAQDVILDFDVPPEAGRAKVVN